MRLISRIFLTFAAVMLFTAAVHATPVTVASTSINSWRYGDGAAYLYVYANSGFTPAGGGGYVMAGARGSGRWNQKVTCTASGGVLSIPTFTIESTTDSPDNNKAVYTFIFADSKGTERDVFAANMFVPPLPTSTDWTTLRMQQAAPQGPKPPTFWTTEQAEQRYNSLLAPNARTTIAGKGYASKDPLSGAPTFVTKDDLATTANDGVTRLATSGGTTAGTVVQANDSRLSNSRTPSGSSGGDLSGTYPGPTVAKIQGRAVSATTPMRGQALVYNSTTAQWEPGTPAPTPTPLPVLVRDEFDSVDGTAGVGREPRTNLVGASWLGGSGTWTIQGGKLIPPASYANDDTQWFDAGRSDFTVSAVVTGFHTTLTDKAMPGLIFRREDDRNYWLLQLDTALAQIILYEKTNGVFTTRATLSGPASGQSEIITVTCVGSNIWVGAGGLVPTVYTSSAHRYATGVGLRAGSSVTPVRAPTFDDFTLLPALQKSSSNPVIPLGASGSWEDGDVAAPSKPVWDAANSRYVIAYSGFSLTTQTWCTGFAYTTNLEDASAYTKEPTNPKFCPVTGEGYIAASADISYASGTWWMEYQGAPGQVSGGPIQNWRIYAASSPNMTGGGTWTRLNGGNPILPLGASGAFDQDGQHDASMRFRTDERFELFFAGRKGSEFTGGHVVCPTLLTCGTTSQLNVMGVFGAGAATDLGSFAVDGDDPNVYSIYFHRIPSNVRYVLRADTTDGGQTFDFYDGVLFMGASGFDTAQVYDDAPVTIGGKTYVLYGGGTLLSGTEGMNGQIGVTSFFTPTQSAASASAGFLSLTDSATVTWPFTPQSNKQSATITLSGNRTLAITGAVSGTEGRLVVVQDGTGSRTLTLPANSIVAGGASGAVTLTTTAGAKDVLEFFYDGQKYFWRVWTNFN